MPIPLSTIVDAMRRIAPPHLAEDWDNVGLLVEPTRPRKVARILMTIDLTAAVMDEAIASRVQMIVAYHPPIFSPLKRLCGGGSQRTILRAIEAGIAIYSPHTALDAAPGGMGDWLCDGLGEGVSSPIQQASELPRDQQCKVVVFVPSGEVDRLRQALVAAGAGHIGDYTHCSFGVEGQGSFLGGSSTNPAIGKRGILERGDEVRLEMVCPTAALPAMAQAITQTHPYEEPAWDVYALQPKPVVGVGAGRVKTLTTPITLNTFIARTKKLCGLKAVRVAAPDDLRSGERKITTIAACPGAGGSLFEGLSCDAYLTGEMRHHDVLAKVEAGSAVILTDHTNTERGYLPVLRQKLLDELGTGVQIDIAKRDADPLQIV